jgi:hypothetical protein
MGIGSRSLPEGRLAGTTAPDTGEAAPRRRSNYEIVYENPESELR